MEIREITVGLPKALFDKLRHSHALSDTQLVQAALEEKMSRQSYALYLEELEAAMLAEAKSASVMDHPEDIAWIEAMQADSWEEPPYQLPL